MSQTPAASIAGRGDAFSILATGDLVNGSANNCPGIRNSLVHLLNDRQVGVRLSSRAVFGFFLLLITALPTDPWRRKTPLYRCRASSESPARRAPEKLTSPPSEDRWRENVVEDFVAHTFWLSRRWGNGTEDAIFESASLSSKGVSRLLRRWNS